MKLPTLRNNLLGKAGHHGGPSQLRSDGVNRYFYEALPPETFPAASFVFPPIFFSLLPPPVSSFPAPTVEVGGSDVDADPAFVFFSTPCTVVGVDPLALAPI